MSAPHLTILMNTPRSYLVLGLGLGLLLAVVAGAAFFVRPYTYNGSLIENPVPAADFTLTDQNGQSFQLAQKRGKTVLVFFGYTHCPDVCPATLAIYAQVRRSLGEQAGEVQMVLITVDPERDTPELLGAYIEKFDPAIIGLTGDRPALEAVWQQYGVFVEKQPLVTPVGGGDPYYEVDHTARVYVVDAQGNLRMTFPFGMETDKIIADIQQLLKD